MPTSGVSIANTIDPVLTGLFYERSKDHSLYRGLRVFPAKELDGLTGQYHERDGKPGLTLDRTTDPIDRTLPMSLQAPSRPMGIKYRNRSIELDRYSDHIPIDDRTARHYRASGSIDVMANVVDDLVTMVHDVHEYAAFRVAAADSNNYGVTDDPGNLNTASTPILKPLQALRRSVAARINRPPNLAVMSSDVRDAMLYNVDVTNRPAGLGNAAAQHADEDMLVAWFRAMLKLDLVVVENYYTDASGAPASFLDDRIIVAYTGDSGATWGNTFVEPNGLGDRQTIAGLREVETDDPKGLKVIADVMHRVRIANPDAAGALTGVLTA